MIGVDGRDTEGGRRERNHPTNLDERVDLVDTDIIFLFIIRSCGARGHCRRESYGEFRVLNMDRSVGVLYIYIFFFAIINLI